MMSDESAEFDGMKTQKERILAREAARRVGVARPASNPANRDVADFIG